MQSRQQQETAAYFNEKARNWDDKARGLAGPRVNVIAQRNEFVLRVAEEEKTIQRALDVGCGVGDLSCELARRGIETLGIDFASDMINLARARSEHEHVAGVAFEAGDFFTLSFEARAFDLIAANGFIEYISYDQRDAFFESALRLLSPRGSLVISSRNRLFNLFSLNEFTEQELQDHTVELLLQEAKLLAEGSPIAEIARFVPAPFQQELITHSDTGIGVNTRYQYTPVQLVRLLQAQGFRVHRISPIHIHAVTPALKRDRPEVHIEISNRLQQYAFGDMRLLHNASAFMIHATAGGDG